MSNSPASRFPRGRILAGVVVVLLAAGWGAYSVIHRPADPVNEAELEDDFAFMESAGTPGSDREPRRLSTGTFTDVMTAGHRESDDQLSTVSPAGFEQPRPASNPAAWLNGTIEDVATEPAPWPLRAADAPVSRGFNRPFTTK